MMFIDELLVQMKIANNMDFCGDLANIQSIFNYANEYIKPLNKIRFRGGKCCFLQLYKSIKNHFIDSYNFLINNSQATSRT